MCAYEPIFFPFFSSVSSKTRWRNNTNFQSILHVQIWSFKKYVFITSHAGKKTCRKDVIHFKSTAFFIANFAFHIWKLKQISQRKYIWVIHISLIFTDDNLRFEFKCLLLECFCIYLRLSLDIVIRRFEEKKSYKVVSSYFKPIDMMPINRFAINYLGFTNFFLFLILQKFQHCQLSSDSKFKISFLKN
jgi:hypothetical protein